jgi:hypothetical protein
MRRRFGVVSRSYPFTDEFAARTLSRVIQTTFFGLSLIYPLWWSAG